ncbi:hypothetical protein AVEN_216828-1 [Araneus ventricosus]|uniref:Uncharacterized protein n=1 Tax=Araneus ventricosus TaxID=182803 RepID=A0A4Y2JIA5_ARAVE|nr:hypothetical protein AVEN_216828-1 [Araneus ventricosus]
MNVDDEEKHEEAYIIAQITVSPVVNGVQKYFRSRHLLMNVVRTSGKLVWIFDTITESIPSNPGALLLGNLLRILSISILLMMN